MNRETAIMGKGSLKISWSALMLVILSVILGTFLRISLLPLYPLVAIIVMVQLRLRVAQSCIGLLNLVALTLLLSLFNGFYPKYNLVSLFYMLPFLLLLFSHPGKHDYGSQNLVKIFLNSLAVVAMINNITGLTQFIIHPGSDDSFMGLYSSFSISLNGLSLINAILFVYYFHVYSFSKRWKYLWWGLFFLTCSILGFYGAGLIAFMAAFIMSFITWNFARIIRIAAISLILLAGVYYTIALVKPGTLKYNMVNIKSLASFDIDHGPRKLAVFYNYLTSYPKNIKDFVFGSGPGTFNSRSAFIVGSPSYFSGLPFLKSDEQPYYFKNHAYTLWNDTNTSQTAYQDGFRNQPFSSLLAFLGEYGLLFTIVWGWSYFRYYKQLTLLPGREAPVLYFAYRRFTKFLFCLLLILLLIDNFFEYPEIMLLILVMLKLLHIEMLKMTRPVLV